MSFSVATTVALKIHCEVELTTLSDEELTQLIQSLEAAEKTVRSEKARRWVAAGKPQVRNPLLDKVWAELGGKP
jgi:hypothetical protein